MLGQSQRTGRKECRPRGTRVYGPSESALRLFAAQANKSSLHPLDWERFYRFVVSAHQFRKAWSHTDVKHILEKLGFPTEMATELAEAYWHGRCSLHLSRNSMRGTRHSGWVRSGRVPMN